MALGPEDSHHALRVLRLGAGDACEVVVTSARDSAGAMTGLGSAVYAATVRAAGRAAAGRIAGADPGTPAAGAVKVRLVVRLEGAEAGASYRTSVGVVQALVRPAAIDYLLEKGTEVGASFFFLFEAAGSPRGSGASKGDRLTRWRSIVREAAKQSKQTMVPPVDVMSSMQEALAGLDESGALSLVLDSGAPGSLEEVTRAALVEGRQGGGARTAGWPARLALWVGPESGWTRDELDRLSIAGVEGARLGQSVLRTETAGPVAVTVARLALGDW